MPSARDRRAERIEWIAGAVSALVVAAMVGFLVYEATLAADSPPDLRVVVEPPAGNHLRYAVENAGGRTASRVTLSLVLRDGERTVEKRSVTLDDVPPHSRVTGGLYLPSGAEALDIDLAVEGYVDP